MDESLSTPAPDPGDGVPDGLPPRRLDGAVSRLLRAAFRSDDFDAATTNAAKSRAGQWLYRGFLVAFAVTLVLFMVGVIE